jgi:Gram-negative bacterial TonB protein C-terminal
MPPVYPPFAQAAGIEGVVRIEIGIYEDGLIHASETISGPPSLRDAAEAAVSQFVYKPFEKDGHAVIADTTVDVAFRLPAGRNFYHPPPPPDLSNGTFQQFDGTRAAAPVSPELQDWLAGFLRKMTDENCPDDRQFEDSKGSLPAGSMFVDIPINAPAHRLYVVSERKSCMCGATGNCPIQVVEEDVRGVHVVADTEGWGFLAYTRQGSPDPDLFFAAHMSASETDVVGYVSADGEWGPLYCGQIVDGKSNVQVCR